MIDFDPNGAAPPGCGLFALPYSVDDAAVIIVPVPWDATSSQARASSGAPASVYSASKFVELYDAKKGPIYRKGITMDATRSEIAELNDQAVAIQALESFSGPQLTEPCQRLNKIVRQQVSTHLDAEKCVGVLGGDHSVSFGAIDAYLAHFPEMGILQFDAHCDLRSAYDQIVFSHASIMYNVMELLKPDSLVQVGVRGLCDFEADYVRQSEHVHTFFDADLHELRAQGLAWHEICSRITAALPDEIYVSLDIDGLEPAMCPNTGTMVPGGLTYNDTVYLLHHITASGRRIVGFDLVEVGSDEYDASIAAHLLYQLCGFAG